MEHYFTNNENLKSEIRKINYKLKGLDFNFLTDNGVFSKNKIDYGSSFLVNTYLSEKSNVSSILDIGCGYGFIGIVIASFLHVDVTFTDINKRAIHLTEKNIKNNHVIGKCFYSDAYENISEKYDLIITNPPIRVGKEKLLEILLNAKNYLTSTGQLWFVIRKNQGAKSILKSLKNEYKCEIIAKSKGFYVIKAKIC